MSNQVSWPEPVACSFENSSPTRREFLTRIRGTAALTLASGAVTSGSSAKAGQLRAGGIASGSADRVLDSYQNRLQAARAEANIAVPTQTANGDEQTYPNFIGNFSKGLPHAPSGEVVADAYGKLLDAVREGTATAFEDVPLGGNTPLVNPLAGAALDLEGTDSHQLAIPAFPPVASRDLADQAIELYWMALCRDVNFLDYKSNPLTRAAAAELARLPRFNGITPSSLFRGFTREDLIGPYVSQFLLKPFNYGPYALSGTMRMYVPGINYMTGHTSWLNVQNGAGPFASNKFESAPRYTCTGRDLTVYVHADPNAGLLISFYNAGIWLFEQNAPLNQGNPYTRHKTQIGFATFGVPHFLCLLGEAKQRACKAAWYAKWFVHRALRPEAYGGLVHMTATGRRTIPSRPTY